MWGNLAPFIDLKQLMMVDLRAKTKRDYPSGASTSVGKEHKELFCFGLKNPMMAGNGTSRVS